MSTNVTFRRGGGKKKSLEEACSDNILKGLTQTSLDDFDGAVVVLNGLVVLVHVAQRGGHVVVSLRQQATVGGQVLQLQGKTLLEVFQGLWVVTWTEVQC